MDIFQILILGLIQGVTEWIPISSKTLSSSAYLLMGGNPAQLVPLLLYLHLGTMLAAIIYFRIRLIELLRSSLKIRDVNSFCASQAGFYFSALFATGLVGLPLLLLQKFVFENLETRLILIAMGFGLLITSGLLHSQKGKTHVKTIAQAGAKEGFITGLFQGLSVLAGVSRSGTTTTALAWQKFQPQAIFELSFILSIPTVLAAEFLFYFADANFSSFDFSQGMALALSSFIFGYATIGVILSIAKRLNLAMAAATFGLLMIVAAFFGLS